MTAPRNIPSAEAGFSGCLLNARCFYEGSSKERLCAIESMCIRDQESRTGHERINASPLNGEREVSDAGGEAPVLP